MEDWKPSPELITSLTPLIMKHHELKMGLKENTRKSMEENKEEMDEVIKKTFAEVNTNGTG